MANTKLEICKKCWGTGHVHGGDENSTWSKSCEDCHGIGFIRVPKTNADRIRAMSDEELAEFLNRVKEPCDYCQLAIVEGACTETLCDDAMMKWLKQPAEE